MSGDYSSSRSTLPEHPPQITRERFRFFVRCKVAAGSMFRLKHDFRFRAKEPVKRFALSLDPTNNSQMERQTL